MAFSDRELLARLIQCEAGGEGENGMKAVAGVVMNRVHAKGGENYSGRCYISHSASIEDAEAVKALVEERFKKVKSVEIFDIGTVIGSHTGPGTVALFFEGTERAD